MVVGDEDYVGPTVLFCGGGMSGDEEHAKEGEEVEGPNAKAAADDEAGKRDRATVAQFFPELTADKEPAEDEEEIDANPTVGDERNASVPVGAVFLNKFSVEVAVYDEENGDGPEPVQVGDLRFRREH